jgi:biopolymer transport protein TolR
MTQNIPRKSKNKRRQMAEINVVPYIDVMLVLLVIFMMTTPLLSQGVKVDLPKANAQVLEQKAKEPIIVSVNAQGQYFVNLATKPTDPLEGAAIQSLVHAALAKDASEHAPARSVLVKADQSVRYGDVMKIMALLQQAGAEGVGLVTEDGAENTQVGDSASVAAGNAWRAG